jgi:hypothetical protein
VPEGRVIRNDGEILPADSEWLHLLEIGKIEETLARLK